MKRRCFEIVIRFILAGLFLVSGFFGIFYKNYFVAFTSLVALFLILFSFKFTDEKGVQISSFISAVFLGFIFLSLFLGEINAFYARFWWWDLLLHSMAGFMLGLMGFSLVYYMNKSSRNVTLNPYFISFFGFGFAITLSVFWEFFEFSVDYFFGTNMLKSGLMDTMGDLIVAAMGAFVVSLIGYLGLKHYYKIAVRFFDNLLLRND